MSELKKLKLTRRAIQHTKSGKRQEYIYEVRDENDTVLCERKSVRNYVACYVTKHDSVPIYNAPFFFSRLDLMDKGDSKVFRSVHWKKIAYGIAYREKDLE